MADQASPFIMDIKNIFYAAVKQSNSWVTEMNIFLKAQKLKAKPLIKQALVRLKTCQGPAKVAVSLITFSMSE